MASAAAAACTRRADRRLLGRADPQRQDASCACSTTWACEPPYDAIVGADFLLQADLEISLAEKQLRFFRPHNCKDTFLGYWSQGRDVEVPLTGRFGDSRNQLFTVELNGVKLDAIIDTGASRSFVFAQRRAQGRRQHRCAPAP